MKIAQSAQSIDLSEHRLPSANIAFTTNQIVEGWQYEVIREFIDEADRNLSLEEWAFHHKAMLVSFVGEATPTQYLVIDNMVQGEFTRNPDTDSLTFRRNTPWHFFKSLMESQ